MKSHSVQIREATVGDALALARLRYQFRAAEGATVESREQFEQRCSRWIEERLGARAGWRCWVAEDRGLIVGHVWLQLFEKVPNPVAESEIHGYITNLYVGHAARGQSIGTQLLRMALATCRHAEVDSVILWATPRSRSLYLRQGFRVSEALLELSSSSAVATDV